MSDIKINNVKVKLRGLSILGDGRFKMTMFRHYYEEFIIDPVIPNGQQLLELDYMKGMFTIHEYRTVDKFYTEIIGVIDELV